MTTVIKNDKKKAGVPNLLRKCGTSGNECSSFRHQVEVRVRLGFESELAARHEEVKMRVEHQLRKCKDCRKLRPIFWGGVRKGTLHQLQTCKDETNEQTR